MDFLNDPNILVSIVVGLGVLCLILVAIVLKGHNQTSSTTGDGHLTSILEGVLRNQSELAGRLSQLSETQSRTQHDVLERLQSQERAYTKTLDERLHSFSQRMGEGLLEQTKSTAKHMSHLSERLAVIDHAQKNIMDLSQQVVGLQDILSNKQSRGAFGEVQLDMLVRNALPPSAYKFQETLSNGKRVDCLLNLPNPPGSICIDAKFPLESYKALQNAQNDQEKLLATRAFKADILKHIKDISEKYILAGETAESALMFLPSEAVYAELHANYGDVVERSYQAKVWIVSPTTLMATLNTVRAVLKDARMREEAGRIQREVSLMMTDVERLDNRVNDLQGHFDKAVDDMRKIRISSDKVLRRGERIEEIQLGEDGDDQKETALIAEPAPQKLL